MYMKKIDMHALLCPICKDKGLAYIRENLFCENTRCIRNKEAFSLVNQKPILIDFENSLINRNAFSKNEAKSLVKRSNSRFKKWMRKVIRGENNITQANVKELIQRATPITNPKILVVGGGEVGYGLDDLYDQYQNNIVAFDIYDSEYVDFIADAHMIPTKSGYFDLVIIQAVLEHVLNPQIVVSEINRVLKNNGLVYAETPFIQQVHEGPFDFTRFTESGHRYLFKKFELVSSGYISGVGSSLIWALDFFFSGLFRTRLAGKFARLLFFWLHYFDRFIPESYNIDGACGVYFMGVKNETHFDDKKIITHYKGNQK